MAFEVGAWWLASTVCLISLAGYYYLQNAYSYWTRKGVKGPKPWPLLGNFVDLLINNRLQLELDWAKRYGKVYGTYAGLRPRLVIADPEVLQQICIKDFDSFPNHEFPEFSSKYSDLSLIKLKDEQWKRTRAIISPTFTSGRIRRMFKLMDVCSDDLVRCYAQQFPKNSQSKGDHRKAIVNVKEIYNLFTMDTICSCGFSIKLDRAESTHTLSQAASKNEFLEKAMRMFDIDALRTAISVCGSRDFIKRFNIRAMADGHIEPLAEMVRRIIATRRSSSSNSDSGNGKKKFDDYLQSVIDARLNDKMELSDMDSAESHHVGLTRESMLRGQEEMVNGLNKEEARKTLLTDMEILAGSIFILAVGLETTGSLLTHCTYALAYYPEVQERLHGELMKVVGIDTNDDGKRRFRFEYDAITSCRYLDAVLSETLRRLNPVIMLDRIASRDYHLKKYDIHLPKGSELLLAYHAIHNDPDYWHEPERFDPERFMPGNREKIVPGSYCPFGLGPRHCIGMRFALTEAKLFLAKMILNYRFEPAPGLKFPPEPKLMLAVTNLKAPLVTLRDRI